MRYTLEEIGNPDFVSISAHKFYGLKGSGIMYISPRARAEPLSFSSVVKGPQQRALRGGTENVMAIASIIPALEYNFEEGVQNRISLVTDYLTSRLRRFNKDWVHIHGPENPAQRVNNTVFVTFPKAAKCSFGLVQALAEQGIDVGAGSACKVNEFAKSKKEMPDHSIRISVGRSTSGLDCDKLIEALDRLIH
jgi:cysteine desulfurase